MIKGGASTQVAFQIPKEMSIQHKDDLKRIQLRYMDGTGIYLELFVATWLGFGANQARIRYLEGLKSLKNTLQSNQKSQEIQEIQDECLPLGLHIQEHGQVIKGMGKFESCLESQIHLLNKHLSCPDSPCYFNGMHIPIHSFSSLPFFGVSEFFYSLHDVFNLSGNYNYNQVFNSTREYCLLNWKEIEMKFKNGYFPFTKDISRLHMQCFKASWILTILFSVVAGGGRGGEWI